ncbi:abscisate beta-glucosyltransferase-like [Prunus yedoensis var. nudiflora]|uniref:Abscisate beta-glucosyltransferase-like n=1 Tax=Prunus yedoensis var. nudiflora TaxID=2094558 RepID=A0A314ZHU4_PRUYE|nr:abscisate beta-glucosyltransferase-like [Prunus yedoensis var. nudiflora]
MAKVFSSHGAKTTILSTTPANALRFRSSICDDQSLNRSITIRVLNLPNDAVLPDSSMSTTPPWTPPSSENLQAFPHPKPTRLHCHPRLPLMGCGCHRRANE